jgi:SAM-dependent methyltransferase
MSSADTIKKLAEIHTATYDALADEYESRTDDLTSVTKEAVEWMAQYLPEDGKILDLGCGVGLATSFFIKKGFELVCLDISPKMIEYARKRNSRADFFQDDFLTVNFDSKFDGVFAFAFIHLFPKDIAQEVLGKIYGILKQNGIFYVGSTKSENSTEGYEIKKDYEGKYKRYRKHWTKEELRSVLENSGFTIVDIKDYADPFGKIWMDFIARKV